MSQTYYPAQAWTELEAKDIVRVIEPGRVAYRATIDTKTPDSSVVWVITATGYRRAFDAREGVRIVLVSIESRAATVEASQICARLRSMVTEPGSSA